MQQDLVTEQHRWLHRLAGEWTWEMEAETGPGQPPFRETGTETVRSLDGVWMMCETRGDAPEGVHASTSVMTLGYDPDRRRFTGTFVATMMTYLWIYEGELDAAGQVLVLHTEGPSYTEPGRMGKYRDTLEFRGDDHRVQTSSFQREDGTWYPFLTTHYRRAG